jgi:hypothetical protein
VPLDSSCGPLSENPGHHSPKKTKRTIQPEDAFEDTAFERGFEIVNLNSYMVYFLVSVDDHRYNGRVDCPSNMVDELGCCGTAEFTCQGSKPCIHESWVCDGHPDCADVADKAYGICSTSSSGSGSGNLRYLFYYMLLRLEKREKAKDSFLGMYLPSSYLFSNSSPNIRPLHSKILSFENFRYNIYSLFICGLHFLVELKDSKQPTIYS